MFTLVVLIILFYYHHHHKILIKEKQNEQLQREKQLAFFKAAVDSEERLKEKIANDLHDGVIPIIAQVSRNLHQFSADLEKNQLKSEQLLSAAWLIDDSVNTLRGVAQNLVPHTLLNFGIIKALQQVVVNMNSNPDCRTEVLDNTNINNQLPFSHNDQLNIYRVCLELINNLRKHDNYTFLQISFQLEDNSLVILFMHDGRGISTAEIKRLELAQQGLGLKSVSTRLALLNGVAEYLVDEFNASIRIVIPLKHDTTN